MAQNFLDKLLTLTGLKLPDTHNPAPSIYRDDVSLEKKYNALSGVERYQQQKNTQSELTGTAKYLAKKQADKKIEKLTSVDKYLAKKQLVFQEKSSAESKMTGVEKYLFQLDANKKMITVEKVKPVVIEKIEIIKQSNIEVEPESTNDAIIIEKNVSEKISIAVDDSEKEQKAAVEIETSEIINFAKGAVQCQATTIKGSQCRRKNNLIVVEKMVGKLRYKFAICRQHDNDAFTPFEGVFK